MALSNKKEKSGSDSDTPGTGDDLRRDPRITTYNIVEICGEAGEFITAATIREISKRGAHLQLSSWIALPKRIRVHSRTGQMSNMATLKWTAGLDIGVEFDEDVRVPRQRPSAEERIRVVTSHLAGKPVRS